MNQTKFLIYFIAFLVLQPVIDVLTAGSKLLLGSNITIGVMLRFAYMGTMGLFLLWMARSNKLARGYILYLVGLGVIIGINIFLNMGIKDPYYLFQELKFFNKVVYFHIVFLGFMIVYKQLQARDWDIEKHTTKYMWLAGFIIGAVFIVAQVTGTSLSNYAHSKVGYSGWFYAGNEIGAIMAIILPILALYAIKRTTNAKKPWFWIPFVMLSLGMLALGTKVGYGGILVVLLSVLIGSIIMYVFMKLKTQQVKSSLIISFGLIVLLAAATPFTPVFGNMYAHFDILNISPFGDSENEEPQFDENGEEIIEEEPEITDEQIQNLIFSSREKYEKEFNADFNSSPITQKLFGMGFAGNYEEPELGKDLKMIEMDFHDLFYSFGWIGFFYLMAPFFWYTGKFLLHFVRNIKTHFTYLYILYGVAFLLAVGIAYTAGHVLTAPAVSIYIAAILAMLNVREKLIDL
ncbi:O-antigen ligase family protein [Paenisporosarcina quisquiliarum]|uniref:O-antigen ligase family protein n=1 Tax=Paenisporosarcina quisquiliarum TaxID=365346 RepID=A0A9X3LF60_9BACL|nr:O-antigen ligase family protein [Paenisporosarcina quisquiliarum]MCZ8536637.1 O-antigen ligase family protein [Paenisporosarcina quisquiliarum]